MFGSKGVAGVSLVASGQVELSEETDESLQPRHKKGGFHVYVEAWAGTLVSLKQGHESTRRCAGAISTGSVVYLLWKVAMCRFPLRPTACSWSKEVAQGRTMRRRRRRP